MSAVESFDLKPWTGPMPERCQCLRADWYDEPWPVCHFYRPSTVEGTVCEACEHPQECHTGPRQIDTECARADTWTAWRRGDLDIGVRRGYGRTAALAVADLIEQEADDEA